MGTFHIIDNSKFKIFYRGNRKTCGRCHRQASDCPGEAVARNCAQAGGERVFLTTHMKNLWKDIDFTPVTFELDEEEKTEDDIEQEAKDAVQIRQTSFPPRVKLQAPTKTDIEKFDGITIRNFPRTLKNEEIRTLLTNHGLPADHKTEDISINRGERNTCVIIENIIPEQVQALQMSIHFHETNTKFFDVPLFCKPRRIMTPVKIKAKEDTPETDVKTATTKDPGPPKPLIPGLPEAERLKGKKQRKKKTRKSCDLIPTSDQVRVEDFISSSVGPAKASDLTLDFTFSDYDDDKSGDEAFEDSLESHSDNQVAGLEIDKPPSGLSKRAARSPPEHKEKKKSRSVLASQ